MINYESLLNQLDSQVDTLLRRQVLDCSSSEYGGIVNPPDGMAGGTGVSSASAMGYAYLLEGSRYYGDSLLVERILLLTEFGRRVRRPSGCFDLIITNFDSSPDTAFLVKAIGPVVKAAKLAGEDSDEGAIQIAESLGEIIRTAVPGIVAGGFHTPNHRWVVVAALALAQSLYPELGARETIEAYLAETIDINSDGEYIERSASVYNAVCNRSLRIAAQELDRPELLDPVRRNLDMSYHLIHADGSVVTSISRRQDRSERVVPARLVDSFYALGRIDNNGFYAAIADWLFEEGNNEIPWVLHPFLEHPEWRRDDLVREPLPETYSKVYPVSGLWRIRRERASATVAKGLTTPFSLKYGNAELSSVKLCASYFGTSQFVGESFSREGDRVVLRHPGKGWHHDSPGYFQPLGRPVEPKDWSSTRMEREFLPVPPLVIDLSVEEMQSGFDLHILTTEGLDNVPFQIECDFLPGGEFDTDGVATLGQSGETLFLKRGYGIYHVGEDAISIGPGESSHRMWQMHNSEKAPDLFRVLLTLVTPVNRVLEIRYGFWSSVTESIVSDL